MTPADLTRLQTMVNSSRALRGAGIAIAESNQLRILQPSKNARWVVAADAVPTDQYRGDRNPTDRLRALLSKAGFGTGTFTRIGGLDVRLTVFEYSPSSAGIAFQNFDQKANQTFNMLSSVVKTMSEMRGIGAGNRSGL